MDFIWKKTTETPVTEPPSDKTDTISSAESADKVIVAQDGNAPQNVNKGVTEAISVQKFEDRNDLVSAIESNETAIELAKRAFSDIEKQSKMASEIEKVADENFKADVETARLRVANKDKDNKIKRQEIKNELLKLKQEAVYLKREQAHKLKIQKLNQRQEKYGELLIRYKIDYLPNAFVLFCILCLDGFVSCLNAVSKVISGINRNLYKAIGIILLFLFIFITPFRNWILTLIGGG